MMKTLNEISAIIENCMRIQRDCCHPGNPEYEYMHGMLNGLIFSHSVINDIEPKFESSKRRRQFKNKVRHKGKK